MGLVQYLMSLFYRQSDRKIPDTDAEYGPDNSPGWWSVCPQLLKCFSFLTGTTHKKTAARNVVVTVQIINIQNLLFPCMKTSYTFTCTRLLSCVCVLMKPRQSVLEGLVQKNHVTQLLRTPDSVVQAVVRQGERLCAESDPRKGGYPAGYWPQVLLRRSPSGQSPRRHSDGAATQSLHWRLQQCLS